MRSLTMSAHIEKDGSMTVQMPMDLADQDVEVVVVVQPRSDNRIQATNDWPDAFFAATAGKWQGEPLRRAPLEGRKT